jgi:dTDP-4-dehydrorhamnose 3,5-epimerase-like enzyme
MNAVAARGLDTEIAQESSSYNLAGWNRARHFHDRRHEAPLMQIFDGKAWS